MNPEFQDKVAVVTGAGGTLCSAIAKHLHLLGCKVVLVDRTREKLEAVANDMDGRPMEPWRPATDLGEHRFLLAPGDADILRLADELDMPPVVQMAHVSTSGPLGRDGPLATRDAIARVSRVEKVGLCFEARPSSSNSPSPSGLFAPCSPGITI